MNPRLQEDDNRSFATFSSQVADLLGSRFGGTSHRYTNLEQTRLLVEVAIVEPTRDDLDTIRSLAWRQIMLDFRSVPVGSEQLATLREAADSRLSELAAAGLLNHFSFSPGCTLGAFDIGVNVSDLPVVLEAIRGLQEGVIHIHIS